MGNGSIGQWRMQWGVAGGGEGSAEFGVSATVAHRLTPGVKRRWHVISRWQVSGRRSGNRRRAGHRQRILEHLQRTDNHSFSVMVSGKNQRESVHTSRLVTNNTPLDDDDNIPSTVKI